MAEHSKWLLMITEIFYWLILVLSLVVFFFAYLGAGMSPGAPNTSKGEAFILLLFPAVLLLNRYMKHKLLGRIDRFSLLRPSSIIPAIQFISVWLLI